jgi:hypothetical protein
MRIFGLKIYHLATLIGHRTPKSPKPSIHFMSDVDAQEMCFLRQGDQMRLKKIAQNISQSIFCRNYCITATAETSGQN